MILKSAAGRDGVRIMIKEEFHKVYSKFKLHFYHEAFKTWRGRNLSLTTVEAFCMEIIYMLERPTVSEFSNFASLSSANAADKINNLIKKGYLNKVQSKEDRRKYYLVPTDKYENYYFINNSYIDNVMEKVEDRFSEKELETFRTILSVMSNEFMDA